MPPIPPLPPAQLRASEDRAQELLDKISTVAGQEEEGQAPAGEETCSWGHSLRLPPFEELEWEGFGGGPDQALR